MKRFSLVGLILCIFLYCLLTVWNLNRVSLWGDESYRAMIGINTLKTGLPTHWDGERFVGGVSNSSFSPFFPSKYIDIASGWLQYYLIAFSFLIFGIATWSARFPFWLAGVLIIPLLFYYKKIFHHSFHFFYMTVGMLLTNVTFLLYSNQANYYMVAILLTLASSLIFWDITENKDVVNFKKLSLLFIVNQFLVHTHIPTFIAIFLIQFVFFEIWLFRNKQIDKVKILIYTILSIFGGFMGYMMYNSSNAATFNSQFLVGLLVYINDINFYVFSGYIGISLCVYAYIYRSKIREKLRLFYILFLSITEILFISFINYGGAPSFRYISSLIGLWFIGAAIILSSLSKRAQYILIMLILLTNLFTGLSKIFIISFPVVRDYFHENFPTIPLISSFPVRCFFCEYIHELNSPKPHPYQEIISKLNTMNLEGLKLIVSTCEGNTVSFYTNAILIDQIPKELYLKKYNKPYSVSDANIIINTNFCPLRLNDNEIHSSEYSVSEVKISDEFMVHSEELNLHQPYRFVQPFYRLMKKTVQ